MSTRFHRACKLLFLLCGALFAMAWMKPAPATAITQTSGVIISAVLPNPSSGPEWVVIENRASDAAALPHQVFLPLMMNCIGGASPISTIGQPPALSIANIAGWQLGDGNDWYVFPENMPDIPAGAKVTVYFDGLGAAANDYDFSDGMATLHSPAGMVNVFPDTAGRALLYAGDANTPENLRAQYEWGLGSED